MIQYTLKCDQDHSFDSWFQSSDAFETLKKAGHLTCPHCGSSQVEKAIMAPRVVAARKKAKAPAAPAPVPAQTPASAPNAKQPMGMVPDETVQKALQDMKKQVEANSDYVGTNFAKEARSMHLGETPERAIYGETNAAEAKSLIEDGVPVLPLPFTPTRKTN